MDSVFGWLKLDDNARSFRALRAFAIAAGPHIASRARAERMRGSILYVRVESAAWSQQLHGLKSELLQKIQRTPGGDGVNDLRFVVGPLNEAPEFAQERAPEKKPDPPAPKLPPISDEIVRAMSDIKDPELREHFVRLYSLHRR